MEPQVYEKNALFLRQAVATGTVGSEELEYEVTLVNGHTPLVTFKDDKQYLYTLESMVKDAYSRLRGLI